MRPYFAIVKDSFREALASRVLWVLLLLITVLLIGLIPCHWRSTIAATMTSRDIRYIRNLATVLEAGKDRDAPPLKQYIWNSLSESTQKRIEQLDDARGPQEFIAREELTEDFNRLIERDDFYDAGLWSAAKLSKRAEELLKQSKLDEDSRQQLNRLALEAALPGQLRPCPDEAMAFRYAKWDFDFLPPFSRKLAIEMLNNSVLVFMAVFVGFFGIFAAVLVTAPIIPNMLDSGSLYVLLSKPISRPLLFISKFLGGCSFVLINASYLIVGLWLILGFRFGLWKPQILWSIPIFLFSFAIFYSVSALSGLIWRSTVMAIVATILFWFACKIVGTAKDGLEQLVISPQKIDSVLRQEGQLFVTRKNGKVARWNADTNTLEDIFADPGNERGGGPGMMMGRISPIRGMAYDADAQQIIALERQYSQANIVVGKKSEGWKRKVTSPAPRNAAALVWHQGAPIAVADLGVYRISAKSLESQKQGSSIFGIINIPGPPPKELHTKISEGITDRLPGDVRVAFDPSDGDIFIHGANALRKWQQADDDLYRQEKQVDVELEQVTDISAGGGVVVLATMNDTVKLRVFDGESLEQLTELDTASETALRELAVSADGRWIAALFENDRLEVLDRDEDRKVTRLPGQDAIADVGFDHSTLLLVDVNDRILSLSLPELATQAAVTPSQPFINKVYRYLVRPLYLVFPKPAELQNTMQYAITGKDTVEVDGPGMGPGGTTIKLNPWQPLISNSTFIGVMLLIGCLYVARQDF